MVVMHDHGMVGCHCTGGDDGGGGEAGDGFGGQGTGPGGHQAAGEAAATGGGACTDGGCGCGTDGGSSTGCVGSPGRGCGADLGEEHLLEDQQRRHGQDGGEGTVVLAQLLLEEGAALAAADVATGGCAELGQPLGHFAQLQADLLAAQLARLGCLGQ